MKRKGATQPRNNRRSTTLCTYNQWNSIMISLCNGWNMKYTNKKNMWRLLSVLWWNHKKCIENWRLQKEIYNFVKIAGRKAQIFMKFYVVVTYLLLSLSFKFHEDLLLNSHGRVVNAHAHVLSWVKIVKTWDFYFQD